MKRLLSGNEAIAQGAYEAGVKVASGYPGTPSTEILENLAKYEGVYAEWAPNEKVALEVAIGASLANVRALAAMKRTWGVSFYHYYQNRPSSDSISNWGYYALFTRRLRLRQNACAYGTHQRSN